MEEAPDVDRVCSKRTKHAHTCSMDATSGRMADETSASERANGSEPSTNGREMPDVPEPVTYLTQSNALMRKNLTFQKRNWGTNLCLILTPLVFSILLFVIQRVVDTAFDQDDFKCGCLCTRYCLEDNPGVCFDLQDYEVDGQWPQFIEYQGREIRMVPTNDDIDCKERNEDVCGIDYSTPQQAGFCEVANPILYPALFQVPNASSRATVDGVECDPDDVQGGMENCTAGLLFTGANETLATKLATGLTNSMQVIQNIEDFDLANAGGANLAVPSFMEAQAIPGIFRNETEAVMGTPQKPERGLLLDSAYGGTTPVYYLLEDCTGLEESIRESLTNASVRFLGQPLLCVDAPALWESSRADINSLLFAGYGQGAIDGGSAPSGSGQWTGAWDFLDSTADGRVFEVNIMYNRTIDRERGEDGEERSPPKFLRLSGMLNAASSSYLRNYNNGTMLLLGLRDMPKPQTDLNVDIGAILGPIFYSWLMQLLLPVMVNLLVYEKQCRIRVMMRMQGLGSAAYWTINFAYFASLYLLYMFMVYIFAYALQLTIITNNSFAASFVFLLVYGLFQVIFAFFLSTLFRSAKTATITIVVYLLCGGLLGEFLLKPYIESETIPEGAIIALMQIPAFALYRGFYELSQYAFAANYTGTGGMTLGEPPFMDFGFIFIIFLYQGFLFMLLALYLERVYDTGLGSNEHPLFFLRRFKKKRESSTQAGQDDDQGLSVPVEASDVLEERNRAETVTDFASNVLVTRGARKTYPAVDGAPPKTACENLSFAVSNHECFGFLGPNGAGKTTSINLMTGLTPPTKGTVFVAGMDIRTDLNQIYSIIGVCPQHDLLWGNLTAREHLLFYGRLKNLKGKALREACRKGLQDVNLLRNGVGDRVVSSYSGGMKRRLSVAISLIGSPRVVFLDEPSTGLDPASRRQLWKVIKAAQKSAGIVLTTHSMEEAEELCGRIGIFVDGGLRVVGNPKELTSRFGGYLVVSLMTVPEMANTLVDLIKQRFPFARCTYSIAGFQKWEMPTEHVTIVDVFYLVEELRADGIELLDWAVANMTLEEVFIKICHEQGVEAKNIAYV